VVPFKVVMVPLVLKRSEEVASVVVAREEERFWSVEEASAMMPVPATFGEIHVELVAHLESPPLAPAAQPKRPADHCRKLLPEHVVRLAPWRRVVEAFWAKKFVLVALVRVAILATREVLKRLLEVALWILERFAMRELVLKLVVVAEVPVAEVKFKVVKFARVLKRSEEVAAVKVPLVPTREVLKRLEEVLLVSVPLVPISEVAKSVEEVAFVKDALVPVSDALLKEVEVALVSSTRPKVEDAEFRFWSVEEAKAVTPPETCIEPCTSSVASEVVADPPMST
jgi:hypothetical protein